MTHQPNTIPESAFPQVVRIEGPTNNPFTGKDVPAGSTVVQIATGLSVRDYFAGKAITGALANTLPDNLWMEAAADRAYAMADAMLKARNK